MKSPFVKYIFIEVRFNLFLIDRKHLLLTQFTKQCMKVFTFTYSLALNLRDAIIKVLDNHKYLKVSIS